MVNLCYTCRIAHIPQPTAFFLLTQSIMQLPFKHVIYPPRDVTVILGEIGVEKVLRLSNFLIDCAVPQGKM